VVAEPTESLETVAEEELPADEASEPLDELPDEIPDEDLDEIESEIDVDEDNLTKEDYRLAEAQIEKYREEFPEDDWSDILKHYKSQKGFAPSVKAAIIKLCEQNLVEEDDDEDDEGEGNDEGGEGVQAASFSDEALDRGKEWVEYCRHEGMDDKAILALTAKDFKDTLEVVQFLFKEREMTHEEVRQDVIHNKRHLSVDPDTCEISRTDQPNRLNILPVRS
jgi:hypothetical protein